MSKVRVLGPEAVPEVADVLVDAFYDYPVMRFVLGESPSYESRLRTLTTFFVQARVVRGEWLLGIPDTDADGLRAAATVTKPSRESPPAVAELREQTWASLGPESRERYEAFGRASAPFEVAEPHLHLSQIGVRSQFRGLGLARVLLEATHSLSLEDAESEGVTLTTEAEGNVGLYQHFGYRVVGRTEVEGAFTTWGFYRPDGHTTVARP
jgi:GNAT superfamily N-acetyltransferase